ncbi:MULTISPECIES: amidase family protein [unclassified Nocardia]|uniref:amidase family protein n=1 Tax=unclassified Nocardia TaxID=2637762 RepID=UPI001CE43FB9|nr:MULTISPECIES: amidase family protein [unclassified Nocardia]
MADDTGDAACLGLREMAAAIARRELSSRDAVSRSLERIQESQRDLNAFRIVRERALAEAAEADALAVAGERPPLLGVPIAVKDNLHVAGEPTAYGCAGTFPRQSADSAVVRRLRDAGAIVVGKTNMCELGRWPFTSGPAFGATRNPWNLDRTPGGSSGGSAAAVAARLVPAALGSDVGGSIRIPAAWTNSVGIRPTRPARAEMLSAAFPSELNIVGPLARTVSDAALLLDIIHPERAAEITVRSRRIAVARRAIFPPGPAPLHADIEAGLLRIAAALRGLGHEVSDAELPQDWLVGLNFFTRAANQAGRVAGALAGAELDERTRAYTRFGSIIGPLAALAGRTESRSARKIGAVFETCDIVLAPTVPIPALPADCIDMLDDPAMRTAVITAFQYTWPWSVLGWPSISIPCGFDSDDIPIGVQLLGPPGSDQLLISVAGQLESELRWDLRSPPYPVHSVVA